MENIEQKRKTNIKKLFFDLFNKNGYGEYDFFDYTIWFLRKNDKKYKDRQYFEELLSETPTEDEDIIKYLLLKSFLKTRNKYIKIRVNDFVEEITETIINLKFENKRVDRLISKYEAYETKNIIEQNLISYEVLMRNNDRMKSSLKVSITEIEKIIKGDYKISLMISYINTNSNYSMDDSSENVKEEVLEYKLNHLVKVKNDRISLKLDGDEKYFFPQVEFFAHEIKNKQNKFSSGTNIMYYYLKIENLNKSFEDVAYSEKKPFLDIFLCNIKFLLNNFQKVKCLQTEIEIKNSVYDLNFKLLFTVDFDPWTLSSIYSKVVTLLQDIITYKVNVEHKWKTINKYFNEISYRINDLFSEEQKRETICLVY